jgi:hypothetical protein
MLVLPAPKSFNRHCVGKHRGPCLIASNDTCPLSGGVAVIFRTFFPFSFSPLIAGTLPRRFCYFFECLLFRQTAQRLNIEKSCVRPMSSNLEPQRWPGKVKSVCRRKATALSTGAPQIDQRNSFNTPQCVTIRRKIAWRVQAGSGKIVPCFRYCRPALSRSSPPDHRSIAVDGPSI